MLRQQQYLNKYFNLLLFLATKCRDYLFLFIKQRTAKYLEKANTVTVEPNKTGLSSLSSDTIHRL